MNDTRTRFKRSEFLVFGAPQIEEEDIQAVVETLRSGWIGKGPKVAQFEREFCQQQGAKWGVGVNSCTAALHLALKAAGVGPGDQVITPALTFCATVNSVIHCGATPVIVDVDPDSWNICPKEIAKKINSKTKAIIPVHFAGRAVEMEPLMELASQHKLKVIEDCAHAIETQYSAPFQDRRAGTLGDMGCFSFYVTKNLVMGEGGIVIGRDPQYHQQIQPNSLHGMDKDAWKRFGPNGYRHFDVTQAGFKYNLTDMAASLGLAQLRRLEKNYQIRLSHFHHYQKGLSDFPLTLPAPLPQTGRHGLHLYNVLVRENAGITRDQLILELQKRNIGIGIHYRCLAEYSYYQEHYKWSPQDYPVATKIGHTTLSLPFSAQLKGQDLDDVIMALKDIF